jgi:hypothetical protein
MVLPIEPVQEPVPVAPTPPAEQRPLPETEPGRRPIMGGSKSSVVFPPPGVGAL